MVMLHVDELVIMRAEDCHSFILSSPISTSSSHFRLLIFMIGPYSLNGVPLRRVNQRYVIGTSTKVPLDGIDVSNIDDSFFAREDKSEAAPVEGRGTVTSDARKSAQKSVDDKLTANIAKVEMLQAYLQAKFSLSGSDRPHALKF